MGFATKQYLLDKIKNKLLDKGGIVLCPVYDKVHFLQSNLF